MLCCLVEGKGFSVHVQMSVLSNWLRQMVLRYYNFVYFVSFSVQHTNDKQADMQPIVANIAINFSYTAASFLRRLFV
jgi:hypothetical protein